MKTYSYRKKPVVVQAFQMTEARRNDNSEWPEWLNRAWNKDPDEEGALFITSPLLSDPSEQRLMIRTLEGVQAVSWGDWIIRGVKGEIYPCKPDIFEATYEPYDAGGTTDGDARFAALLAFARDVLAGYVDPANYELGDLDGADLQDLATRHGLLVPETRRQPCGEGCRCADYYSADEWRDGVTCFTPAEWLQRCGK